MGQKRGNWKRPFRAVVTKRRRVMAERKERKENREVKANFVRHQTRGYANNSKGIAMRKKHEKARAAAKRAKQARKINR